MPIVESGLNPALLSFLSNRKQQRMQLDADEIRNLLTTAHAGQTVAELGITPERFAKMFGKDVPYDPNKQIVDQKSTDVTDDLVKEWISKLSPDAKMNLAGTLMQNKSGIAGFTTSQGVKDQMATGGRKDAAAETVSAATTPTNIQTAVTESKTAGTKADTSAIQAGSAKDAASEVARRINLGIDSMKKAPDATQGALNEGLAFGKSKSGIESEEFQNQLKIATVKEALQAQVNPNHPMNAFLAKNGLDIHTVMAATASGVGQLLDTYARGLWSSRDNNQQGTNILLRMSADAAKDMSEKVFGGKLTPRQVMTIMDAVENGKPIPKGYEGAAAIFQQATNANYQALVSDALQKGDPIAQAAKQALDNMTKLGKEPHQLQAANELARTSAAQLATKMQTGVDKPDERADPKGAKLWQQIYESNLRRMPGIGVNTPRLWFNSYEAVGAPQNGVPGAAPQAAPVVPTKPIGQVPAASGVLTPGADWNAINANRPKGIPTAGPPATPAGQLPPDQLKAIQDWMAAFGASQPAAPTSP